MLWAADVQKTAAFRLPVANAAASCFAPLYEDDVATAVAAVAGAGPQLPLRFAGGVFNLTGPVRSTILPAACCPSLRSGGDAAASGWGAADADADAALAGVDD